MKKIKNPLIFLFVLLLLFSCVQKNETSMKREKTIDNASVQAVIKSLTDSLGQSQQFRIERGVGQVADLWEKTDGTTDDFENFCFVSSKTNPCTNKFLYGNLLWTALNHNKD